VTAQGEILNVLRETHRKFGSALIFITHNPALLAGFADRVIIMYAGRIVEGGPVARVFRKPLHPYTKGLLRLFPNSGPNAGWKRLSAARDTGDAHGRGSADARLRLRAAMFGEDGCLP